MCVDKDNRMAMDDVVLYLFVRVSTSQISLDFWTVKIM